jgi:hypothetical protein
LLVPSDPLIVALVATDAAGGWSTPVQGGAPTPTTRYAQVLWFDPSLPGHVRLLGPQAAPGFYGGSRPRSGSWARGRASVAPDFPGCSLAPATRGGSIASRARYAESEVPRLHYGWSPLRALSGERWKYIRAPRPELYDLAADPGELRNLVDREPGAFASSSCAFTPARRPRELIC